MTEKDIMPDPESVKNEECNEELVRLVTPEQYIAGWYERIGDTLYQRQYRPICKRLDGNWVVAEPPYKK